MNENQSLTLLQGNWQSNDGKTSFNIEGNSITNIKGLNSDKVSFEISKVGDLPATITAKGIWDGKCEISVSEKTFTVSFNPKYLGNPIPNPDFLDKGQKSWYYSRIENDF